MESFTIVNRTLTLVAKRNSGKSFLVKHLLQYEAYKFAKIFVICPTESINHFYSDIIPANCIFDTYSEEWAEMLIMKLTIANSNKKPEEQKKVLLILDDLISDLDFHHSKTLKNIYSRGRHYGLGILVTTQYLNSISPLIRNNTDYLFVGQQNKQSVELLQAQFQSGDISKIDFMKMYYRCTTDYNFLLINCNSVKDTDLNSIYGVIKTPEKEMKTEIVAMEEPEPKEKRETLWGSLFGEKKERKVREDLIPRHNKTINYIKGIKPVIRPAFENDGLA
jgi:hypothetical protein